MSDINNLKLNTEAMEADVDWDHYVDPSEFPPPLPEGIYTFIQGKPTFNATNDGWLSAQMDHLVELPEEFKGRKVSFDRISNKPFDRSGVKVNMMADHLRALGITERPTSHQSYADLLESGEGKAFQAQVQWDGYCGHKGTPYEIPQGERETTVNGSLVKPTTVRGARKFPPLPAVNGSGSPGNAEEMPCPVCGQTITARGRISRRIPASTR